MLYGDLARYPLFVNMHVRCVRYWLKLTRMDEQRLPYQAYKMLERLDNNGKRCWASEIRIVLYKYGFGYVWLNQGAQSVNGFIKCFKQRLMDCSWQNWESHVSNSDRFSFYSTFKSTFGQETYLSVDINRHIRTVLIRFRFGFSDILSHTQRFVTDGAANVSCPLCGAQVEDELHFILCCPCLADVRTKFIPSKYHRSPNAFRLAMLMAAKKT